LHSYSENDKISYRKDYMTEYEKPAPIYRQITALVGRGVDQLRRIGRQKPTEFKSFDEFAEAIMHNSCEVVAGSTATDLTNFNPKNALVDVIYAGKFEALTPKGGRVKFQETYFRRNGRSISIEEEQIRCGLISFCTVNSRLQQLREMLPDTRIVFCSGDWVMEDAEVQKRVEEAQRNGIQPIY
jgi:hypothetical protein